MKRLMGLLAVATVSLVLLAPDVATASAKPGDDPKSTIGVCHWDGAAFVHYVVEEKKDGKPKGHEKDGDDVWPVAAPADCPTSTTTTTTPTTDTTKPPKPPKNTWDFCFRLFKISTGTTLPPQCGTDVDTRDFSILGMTFHGSCSDRFVGGVGQKGGPKVSDDYRVESFWVIKNDNPEGKGSCNDGSFTPPTTTTTTQPPPVTTTTTVPPTVTTTVPPTVTTTVPPTTCQSTTICQPCCSPTVTSTSESTSESTWFPTYNYNLHFGESVSDDVDGLGWYANAVLTVIVALLAAIVGLLTALLVRSRKGALQNHKRG